MPLKATRALLAAALNGSLADTEFRRDPNFGFMVPVTVDGVDSAILDPRSTWEKPEAYDAMAKRLVSMFINNFEKFENDVDGKVMESAPQLRIAAE